MESVREWEMQFKGTFILSGSLEILNLGPKKVYTISHPLRAYGYLFHHHHLMIKKLNMKVIVTYYFHYYYYLKSIFKS